MRRQDRLRSTRRIPACLAAFGLAASVAACGSDEPTSFPPLQYSYLGQLHLNVANLQIVNNATPGAVPGDISAASPTTPDQALLQMAQDRLAAAGSAGNAVFTVDRASILHQPGGMLNGQEDVHVDVISPTGQQVGVAEAHVTRNFKPDLSNGDSDSPANLYELTKEMTQDMNVELEFQVRKSLKDWMVDAGGAPTGDAIQSQSLGMPGAQPPMPVPTTGAATPSLTPSAVPMASVPAAATPVAAAPTASPKTTPAAAPAASNEPDAIFPSGDPTASAATPTKGRSPAAGVLTLPSNKSTTSGY